MVAKSMDFGDAMTSVYDTTEELPWKCPSGKCRFDHYEHMLERYRSCGGCEGS
jgi:hypothetical protein